MKQSGEASGVKVEDKRFWSEEGKKRIAAEQAAEKPPSDEQSRQFTAETQQLLELMIHSLYSDKEIFLRELISNASDALDHLRFAALTDDRIRSDQETEIRLDTDKAKRTLTIIDSGIGMSRSDVIENIGTIAKSGTRQLVERLKSSKSEEESLQLIGQFGVGFYSAFMVADRVTMVTRKAGEPTATRWESTGDGTYRISDTERDAHGTSITLHLKESDTEDGLPDFTEEWVLERIVKKYSDFVRYPIKLKVTREENERDGEGKPVEGGKTVIRIEDRTLNSMKAIWKRRKQDVTDDEYQQFYRQISHDWEQPMRTIPLNAEGRIEYQALLFIPQKAPFDLFHQDAKAGLQLYVQSVKIMDSCEQLLPHYLRFIRGVVESADLPLNVSREILQNNRQITTIQRGLVSKILSTIGDMQKKHQDDYIKFFREFGRTLKEGVLTDNENRDKIVPLLLFETSKEAGKLVTLADYLDAMKPDQDAIYYLTGETRAVLEGSPHLEAFRDRGIDVLFLTDPVDEVMLQRLTEYEGKKLQSAAKGDIELGSDTERKEAEEKRKEQQQELGNLLNAMRRILQDRVKEVRLSSRLKNSPACLVGSDDDLSPHLQRLLKQSRGEAPAQKRVMELNANHPVIRSMQTRLEKDENDPLLTDYSELLFGQALLAEGSELPDPASFAARVADLMSRQPS